MAKRLYVGGLPYSVDDSSLGNLFASYGTVVSANVITDRATGRSKGFGFVELQNDSSASEAIKALNGTELEGRSITVSEARPLDQRNSGGGDGGRGGRRDNRW